MKQFWWIFLLIIESSTAQFPSDDDAQKSRGVRYEGIQGNPYLKDEWSDGKITFSSGRILNQFKLKFDCVNNKLLLQFSGSTFAAESKVKEFVIYQKEGRRTDSMVFRKGFPSVGLANNETFYLVLSEGKVMLLELYTKNILEEKQMATSDIQRRFIEQESFFILRDGIMYEVKKERGSLPDILTDRSEEIKKFIAENQLKMRSGEDFAKVVNKYNKMLP